jgi:nitrogen fixation protein NifQ
MLLSHRTPHADAVHADWLARAIAAASLGRRFLWQDLGLQGREEVGALLREYFEPFYRRNVADIKWKKFLFVELGARQGEAAMPAPGCMHCAQFDDCYGKAALSRGSVR